MNDYDYPSQCGYCRAEGITEGQCVAGLCDCSECAAVAEETGAILGVVFP